MILRKRNKLVFGIGINDADYNVCDCVTVNGKTVIMSVCAFYARWASMLERCYSPDYHKKQPTYIGCTVLEEWLTFSNFKAWMKTQDWEGKQLDKDLLLRGNKVYGPDTCVFVEQRINSFLKDNIATKGEFPTGVNWDKISAKYRARGYSVETGKRKHLGRFDNPNDAHQAWLAFKLKQAYILASQQGDEKIAKTLIERYENYQE